MVVLGYSSQIDELCSKIFIFIDKCIVNRVYFRDFVEANNWEPLVAELLSYSMSALFGISEIYIGHCRSSPAFSSVYSEVSTEIFELLVLQTRSFVFAIDPPKLFWIAGLFWSVKTNFDNLFDKRAQKIMCTSVGQLTAY